MPLVQVALFEDPQEGAIAAASLRAEGVEALFDIDAMGSADPFMRRATGGFPLWVLDDDLADARRILRPLVNRKAGESALPRDEDDSEDDFEERQARRLRDRQIKLGVVILGPIVLMVILTLFAR